MPVIYCHRSQIMEMGQGTARNRTQAERTAWLCSSTVALDRGAYVRLAGAHRRLKADYECLPETTEALIHIAMIRFMVRGLVT
jgi:hypothetical protein